ncbi:phytoene desaturase family protein [Jeotgalibaca sp. MA1X17-3]|uniref:phytoene desaturase family protein n=1 Tax=Jeotgalibaca sp. MA1X17-3 TaxID=2908211 RepID=UPI001F20FCBA|nr:phytoene desaturase family protein [Jeotgalibaca sp. MA1X17-3]UJF16088.1 phytoene desaturase family protein [Jeotgalibaca sp. MA1X17-3]
MQDQKSVVVIGGGLGGLSAAISLAQKGFSVSLYEKNNHLGGKLNRLEQDGFGFDLGPSILTMPHIFQKLFTDSNKKMEDYVTIERLDLEWRSFFPDDTVIDLYGDLEKMEKENPSLTKKDMAEYRDFLDYAGKLYDITEKGYFAEGLDNLKQVLKHHGIWETSTGFDYFSTLHEGIAKRVHDPHFNEMLDYFIKYVGSSAYDAPAILNMMSYMQHQQGVWYVPGGMHLLAEGLVKLAEEIGVTFHLGHEVVKLNKDENKMITSAEMDNGSIVEADYFVSNMEVIPAYTRLLEEDQKEMDALEKKFEPASSGLVIHLGVDTTYPQLAHHNFFFSNHSEKNFDQIFHKKQLPDDPTIYLVNVNKTDSDQALPGHENIKILPHIPYIQDDPFTEEDYLALQERVYEKLEKMGLTDLRKHIVTENVWRPEDIQETYYSNRGAIYGTVSDRKKNQGFKHPKHSEKYHNLYFVGGTVNPGGGMPMVTLSGQQVGDMLGAKEKILTEFL